MKILGMFILDLFLLLLQHVIRVTFAESLSNDGNKNLMISKLFPKLVSNKPTFFVLDDAEVDMEDYVQMALSQVNNGGNLIYTFHPWWRYQHEQFKPKIGVRKSISFQWTFACLIHQKRAKIVVDKYLSEILEIGHARVDNFLLIGLNSHISPFFKTSQIGKFKNILGFPSDRDFVYQGQEKQHLMKGQVRYKYLNDSESISWITGNIAFLNGQNFRISGTRFPPYLDSIYKDGKKTLMGVNYQIFNEGSNQYNYTYTINDESEWKFTGVLYANGTWDGGIITYPISIVLLYKLMFTLHLYLHMFNSLWRSYLWQSRHRFCLHPDSSQERARRLCGPVWEVTSGFRYVSSRISHREIYII